MYYIVDQLIVIRTADRDFRNGALFAPDIIDERRENNIIAYDWKGNYLWNIGDLVGDIKKPFRGFGYISHKEAEEEYGVKVKNPSNILFECIAGGFAFIIDATEKKLLLKVGGMR